MRGHGMNPMPKRSVQQYAGSGGESIQTRLHIRLRCSFFSYEGVTELGRVCVCVCVCVGGGGGGRCTSSRSLWYLASAVTAMLTSRWASSSSTVCVGLAD